MPITANNTDRRNLDSFKFEPTLVTRTRYCFVDNQLSCIFRMVSFMLLVINTFNCLWSPLAVSYPIKAQYFIFIIDKLYKTFVSVQGITKLISGHVKEKFFIYLSKFSTSGCGFVTSQSSFSYRNFPQHKTQVNIS